MTIRTESNIFAIIGLVVFTALAWLLERFFGWPLERTLISIGLYTALRTDAEAYLSKLR